MTDEDIIDCIMEVDALLAEIESAIEKKSYGRAMEKVREARDAIEELREEDCAADTANIEMNMMKTLK